MTRIVRSLGVLIIVLTHHGFMKAAEESTNAPISQFAKNEIPQPVRPLASGLAPAEAAAQMSVPQGFHVTLAAGEPQIHQPIAFAIDERGRLWIAEAYTYPQRAPVGEGRDKIIILEDTDHDGTLDSRKVFMEGLNLVSGIEVGFGGVYIGAAPYLLFVPDQDGDDRPDAEPEVLLDGFGYQDTHETLNSFIWGPDGWLYGCHGVFTHSRVGKPGTPDEARIPLNAGVWRYHPTRHEFDVFARGTSNPWGVDFNDRGQTFITACVIPHLWHMIQGARYHRQGGQHFNPYVFDDIKTIAKHRHYVGDIRDHAWWGNEPTTPTDTLAAGGGHAHCGAMVYLGDNFPERYRNQVFMHNIHGNRINEDLVFHEGSGYVGDHGPDLMLANDRWFRGIGLRYGPYGTVWSLDWYDPNACHRNQPEIWDRTNGRIYNISYGTVQRQPIDLGRLSDVELAELHDHKNEWHVRMSRRLLQARAAKGKLEPAAIGHLQKMLNSEADVTNVLRALWTLHAIGELSGEQLYQLRTHGDEYVRAWTLQLELEQHGPSAVCLQDMLELAKNDPSPVVRLYIASALQRTPLKDRWEIVQALVMHGEDAEDHNLPLMDWYAIEPLVTADPVRALQLAEQTRIPLLKRFIVRRAAAEDSSLAPLVAKLAEVVETSEQLMILQEMQKAFEGRVNIPMPKAWSAAYERLASSDVSEVAHLSDQLAVIFGDQRVFPKMRAVLADASAPLSERQQAMEILVRGRDSQATGSLIAALEDPQLRGSAIRALAAHDGESVTSAILDRYAQLTADEKRDAVSTLTGRVGSANALLTAVDEKRVPRTDLHAFNVQQMLQLDDKKLRDRIEAVWGSVRETSADKQELIAKLKRSLDGKALRRADVGHGRMVFTKTCASCHRLFGSGEQIAPDLTGSNRTNLDYVLQNVVDPSAVLGKDYQQTVIVTEDGRVVTGLVQKETDSAVTLRTINDTIVVPLAEIEERRLSDKSLMPERLLETLTLDDVRDLVAYLASPSQVPLRGPKAEIDESTGVVTGGIEAHSLPVIRTSAGAARRQVMTQFTSDHWSGDDHLWWTGAQAGDQLELEFELQQGGLLIPEVLLTRADDYGIVQLSLDGEPLGEPVDLFSHRVETTGVLTFPAREISPGKHTLTLEIVGTNPQAKKLFMVGIDYLRFVPPISPGS
ncbi:MAG: c-type cytochrome [Planctomycetaceae bacterium]|nr:c-type cytochrome [Planctomycetaceae bacterium]